LLGRESARFFIRNRRRAQVDQERNGRVVRDPFDERNISRDVGHGSPDALRACHQNAVMIEPIGGDVAINDRPVGWYGNHGQPPSLVLSHALDDDMDDAMGFSSPLEA